MRLSIIVPIYNTSKYLERCIMSLVNQTIDDFEILLIDDGSTDNSLEICNKYSKKYNNIKVFSKPNSGLGATRNYGMLYAKGEYVAFVDSDDYVDINMYKVLLELAYIKNSDIASCNYEVVYNEEYCYSNEEISDVYCIEEDKEKIIRAYTLREISASSCDKIFKREFLISIELLFPEGLYYEDINMVVESLYYCNNIVISKNKFYKYFMRNNSITNKTSLKRYIDYRNQVERCHKFIHSNFNYDNIKVELDGLKFLHTNMILKMLTELNKEIDVKEYFEEMPKRLIVFGASAAGGLMKHFCDLFDIEVIYFSDNSSQKWGEKMNGIEIISPIKLKELDYSNTNIYIASMHYNEIYEQLSKYSLQDKVFNLRIL